MDRCGGGRGFAPGSYSSHALARRCYVGVMRAPRILALAAGLVGLVLLGTWFLLGRVEGPRDAPVDRDSGRDSGRDSERDRERAPSSPRPVEEATEASSRTESLVVDRAVEERATL